MEAFETELAALIDSHSRKLTSDQIITGLERALDEALVLAGDHEASKVRAALLEVVPTLFLHSRMHYGQPTDVSHGVGMIHAKTRAALMMAGMAPQ